MALQIHVIAGRDAAQPRRRAGFTRQIPHRPQRAILGAQPPQRKSIQAEAASGAHLVQRGDGIEIPDFVPQIVLVNVTVVRIEGIGIESDCALRFFRVQPCFLRGHSVNLGRRRNLLLGRERPVVSVSADSDDELLSRDRLQRELKIVGEPILRGYRAGGRSGDMLVVVHQDDAVGNRRQRGIIEIVVVGRQIDVQLHAPGM